MNERYLRAISTHWKCSVVGSFIRARQDLKLQIGLIFLRSPSIFNCALCHQINSEYLNALNQYAFSNKCFALPTPTTRMKRSCIANGLIIINNIFHNKIISIQYRIQLLRLNPSLCNAMFDVHHSNRRYLLFTLCNRKIVM